MQKKIIALAVAGLVSGAAFAQSNVTIYGVADGYYGRMSATGRASNNYFNSGGLSGSRLGFRGEETLGGGLKAVFQYELAYNLDNTSNSAAAINNHSAAIGNGINGTRQSYVGMAGGFGTAVVGRLQTPGYYVGKFDSLASAAISPQAILSANQGSTIAPSNAGRVNNAVAYMSPVMSGFSGVLAYGSGEENAVTDVEKESVWGLGLNYSVGPLAVGYVYHNVQNVGADNTATDRANLRENMIGGSYDFGVAKLLGSWQDYKLSSSDNRDHVWQLGVAVPVGMGNVHFAYGRADRDADNMDANSWTLAYTHGFSKRTTGYVGYNRTTNDDNCAAGIIAPTLGGSSKAFVAGVRHTF